ncbi:hypothetical protein Avbf_17733 [Armadillidium vulgare]|nr:hypothetical protein Avbf_17733 [Armadillidium vulgare]
MNMNEKFKPDFKWILPNINAIRELKEFRNRSLFISILIIKNASLSDSGQYVCRVSVLNLLESNTTKNIEIHDIDDFKEYQTFNFYKMLLLSKRLYGLLYFISLKLDSSSYFEK